MGFPYQHINKPPAEFEVPSTSAAMQDVGGGAKGHGEGPYYVPGLVQELSHTSCHHVPCDLKQTRILSSPQFFICVRESNNRTQLLMLLRE